MYLIVVGGGKVGYYLTRTLSEEGHEVILIEKDPRRAALLADDLGEVVLEGDGCEASTLTTAGVGRADVVVAVTGDDEDNLVVCQVAKRKFNVARTIARANNPKNQKILRMLGADVTISSTDLILSQIEEVIPGQSLVHLLRLRNAEVSFVELKLKPDSPALGLAVKRLGIPNDCVVALIIRDNRAIIPSGDTVFAPGDELFAVSSLASEETLRRILGG
jgi:trk system potassium uptake protein TrkA